MEAALSWIQGFRSWYAENLEELRPSYSVASTAILWDSLNYSDVDGLVPMEENIADESISSEARALLNVRCWALITRFMDFANVVLDDHRSRSAEASRLLNELQSLLALIGPLQIRAVSECQTTGSATNGSVVGGPDAAVGCPVVAVGGPGAAADGSSSAEERKNDFVGDVVGAGPRDDSEQKVKDGGSAGSVRRRKVSDEPQRRQQQRLVKQENRLPERDSKNQKSKKDISTRSLVTESDRHRPKQL